MKKKVLLSVVVPVFNNAEYISACIESIREQTYKELEIILVNDGSTDNSGKICDEYALTDQRIRVIHKQNEGACYARRDGILVAKGEYVTFVDSDDWIDSDMYEILFNLLLENEADIVTSGYMTDDGEVIYDLIQTGMYEDSKKEQLCVEMLYDKQYNTGAILMSLWNKIYRKSLLVPFISDLPGNIQLWEDILYVYPPFIYANRVLVTHKNFYHYRNNEGSVSKRFDSCEYEKTTYTFSIAQKIYQQFNQPVCEAFYLENSLILYRYLWKCASNEGKKYGSKKEIRKKFDTISRDNNFLVPVSEVIEKIPLEQERIFLKILLEGKGGQAIKFCRNAIKRQAIRKWIVKSFHRIFGTRCMEKVKVLLKRW